MSTTQKKILDDLKDAMRAKDSQRLLLLRSLKSKLLEKEIAERKEGEAVLNEEQVTDVLMKAAKQRKESIRQFKEAGRNELAQTEEYELQIIESYLPKMLSEEEITTLVQEVIKETQASSAADLGKVMGIIMPKIKGKADGALVNRIVRKQMENL